MTEQPNLSPALLAATLIEIEGRIWAVTPEVASLLMGLHAASIPPQTIAALQEAAQRGSRTPQANGVATIPLKGIITPAPSLLSILFGEGGGGLSAFRSQLASAVADPSVSHIVLDVDSPGGRVDGVPETAAMIRSARAQKPIVAVANTMAASAAYWLASQANEVVVSPSAQVGSIGVYQTHRDMSGALAQAGIVPTLISAGKYKTEGHPYAPLSDTAHDAAQQTVDDFYSMFVKDVAAGRGVDPDTVAGGYGEGRMQLAKRAVASGLADREATLQQTQRRLASGRAKVKDVSAEDQSSQVPADDDDWLEVAAATFDNAAFTREARNRVLGVLAR